MSSEQKDFSELDNISKSSWGYFDKFREHNRKMAIALGVLSGVIFLNPTAGILFLPEVIRQMILSEINLRNYNKTYK